MVLLEFGGLSNKFNKMKVINEQVKIVEHYLNNQDEYRLENGKWWGNLKKIKLKNKDEIYIKQVCDLIDEWIDYGKESFYKRYIN